jgi:hypothetical protein
MANDYDMAAGVAKKKIEHQLSGNYREAVRIATYLVKTHFPDNLDWQPLPTLSGVLSQIDNMICAWRPDTTIPAANKEVERLAGELDYANKACAVLNENVNRLRAELNEARANQLSSRDEAIAYLESIGTETDQERILMAQFLATQPSVQQVHLATSLVVQRDATVRARAIGECIDAAKRKAEEYRTTAERYAENAKRETMPEARAVDEDTRDQCFAKKSAMLVFAGDLQSLTATEGEGDDGSTATNNLPT